MFRVSVINLKSALIALMVVGTVSGLAMNAHAWPLRITSEPRYEMTFEPVGEPTVDGFTTLRLWFKSEKFCTTDVSIKVVTYGDLVYDGPYTFVEPVGDSGSIEVLFKVRIPDNDTSGMGMELGCPPLGAYPSLYFGAVDGEVAFGLYTGFSNKFTYGPRSELHDSPISELPEADSIQPDTISIPPADTVETEDQSMKYPGKVYDSTFGGYFGYVYVGADGTEHIPIHPDSMQYFHEQRAKDSIAKMPPASSVNWLQREQHLSDSLQALPPEATVQVCLMIDTPEKLEFARAFVDSLGEVLAGKYYHTTMRHGDFDTLRNRGIIIHYLQVPLHSHDEPAPGSESRTIIRRKTR